MLLVCSILGTCLKIINTKLSVSHLEVDHAFLYVGGETIGDSSKRSSVLQKYNLSSSKLKVFITLIQISLVTYIFCNANANLKFVLGTKLAEFEYNDRFVFDNFVFVPEKNLICSWNKSKIAAFESQEDKFIEKSLPCYVSVGDEIDKCLCITKTSNNLYVLCGAKQYLHIVNLDKLGEHNDIAVLDCVTNVNCIDFTEDDEYALVGSYRVVKIVHIASGKEITRIGFHSDSIEALKVSLCYQYIVTISKDKNLHIHKYNADTMKCTKVATFMFHCPVRYMAVAKDLSFILVGPESARPLAVLTFNEKLVKKLQSLTPEFSGCPDWNTTEDDDIQDTVGSEVEVQPKITDVKFNEESVDFYAGDTLSLSLNRNAFETCKSICSPLSSVSSGSDLSCCIL